MLNRNYSLLFIAIIFIASWLIPIEINFDSTNTNSIDNIMGYEGAKYAQELLAEGLFYFKGVFTGDIAIDLDGLTKNLFKIAGGSPNILFILTFVLVVFKNKYSFHFIAPCVLIMLLWGDGKLLIGGYSLWVLAGIWLLLISGLIYRKACSKSNAALFYSTPLLITYFVGVLAISQELLP